jgi:hypothetical protein
MFDEQVDERVWYTLQEASKLTGKTPSSLRRLIQRKVIERVKKEHSKHGEHWLIHKEELTPQGVREMFDERGHVQGVHIERGEGVHPNIISFETYDQHRREWEQRCSQLEQGVMMYRYKYEDLDRQVKMLPAPPELISSKVQELEQDRRQKTEALAQAHKILHQAQEVKERYKSSVLELKAKLQEEERAKEALRLQWEQAMEEAKKPWWKKLFGVK